MNTRARWLLRNRSASRVAVSLFLFAGVVVAGCRPMDSKHKGAEVSPRAPAAILPAPSPPSEMPPQQQPAPTEPTTADPLPTEEGEHDPASETVTIAVQVEPPKVAHVFWGPKDLGVAPLEIVRPRASGPVDLILRAPGFLTVHTRAFTDRNDRIPVHLVPETDAPRMFGYRSAAPTH